MTTTLTVGEAAERLRLKPDTVRRWIRQGRIPGLKIGHILRIREEDLERLLAGEMPGTEYLRAADVRGMFADVPGSVDEFLREKHAETEREEKPGRKGQAA